MQALCKTHKVESKAWILQPQLKLVVDPESVAGSVSPGHVEHCRAMRATQEFFIWAVIDY